MTTSSDLIVSVSGVRGVIGESLTPQIACWPSRRHLANILTAAGLFSAVTVGPAAP